MITFLTNFIFFIAGVIFLAFIQKKDLKQSEFWKKAVIGSGIAALIQWIIGVLLTIAGTITLFIPILPGLLIYVINMAVYLVLILLIWRVVLGYRLDLSAMNNDELGKMIVAVLIILIAASFIQLIIITLLNLWIFSNTLRLVVSIFLIYFVHSSMKQYMD